MEDKTIVAIWHKNAGKYRNKTALIYFGKKFTYNEVHEQAERYADILYYHNVKKGDVVALMMANCPQFVFAYLGALMLGAKVTPINLLALPKTYKDINEVNLPDAIREQLKDAKPKAIIAFEMFYPMLKQAAEELGRASIILTGPQDYLPWPLNWLYPLKAKRDGKYVRVDYKKEKGICHLNKDHYAKDITGISTPCRYNHFRAAKLDDVVQLQYTAGTTGVPKGVMLTNENLTENSAQARETLGNIVTDGEEIVLGILPFFHIYGMTVSLLTSLLRGWTIVLVPDPKDVKRWIGWIKKYKATVIPCVPRIYELLIKQYPEMVNAENFATVKLFINGGGALPRKIREQFEKLCGAKILEGYGLSEASPVVSINNPKRGVPGSIGKAVPRTEVKITDIETELDVSAIGMTGEITVRGPQVMAGYYNKPEATAKKLRNDWLYTGDIGYMDIEGNIYLTDRMDDMAKINGENVYPSEVEKVILQCHPDVAEVVVVGIPDAEKGEVLCAVVMPKGHVMEWNLENYVRGKLAPYQIPRRILLIKDMEEYKNNLGKVLRKKVREAIQNETLK